MRVDKYIILFVLLFLTKTSIAGCGDGLFDSNSRLSSYMKDIIISNRAIPVTSKTLGNGTSFSNVIFDYDTETSKKYETGKVLDLSVLEGASGYAYVSFSLKTPFKDIPNVKQDININYPHFKDDFVIDNIIVELRAIGVYGDIVSRQSFSLNPGKNKFDFCAFNSIKSQVREINVELKSYKISYSFSTIRTWD